MSIKVVHIFLIVVSILLSFGFGYWGIHEGDAVNRSMGVGSVFAGVFLIFYLGWFIKKSKRI